MIRGLLAALSAILFLAFGGVERIRLLHAIVMDDRKPNTDLFQNWASARDGRAGRSVYDRLDQNFARFDPHLGSVYAEDETAPNWNLKGPSAKNILQFNGHPPLAAVIASPLGHHTYSEAHTIWTWLNVAILMMTFTLLFLHYKWLTLLLIPLTLASFPLRIQLVEGNWNVILLFLLTLAWHLLTRNRPRAAGFVVAIAALIKIFPGLIFFAFVLKRDWKAVIGFIMGIAVGTIVSVSVLGVRDHVRFVTEVIPNLKMQQYQMNVSLAATGGRLFDPSKPELNAPLTVAPFMVKGFLALWAAALALPMFLAWVRGTLPETATLLAAFLVLALVFSPVLWPHGFLQLLLPLAIALATKSELNLILAALCGWLVWFDPSEVWRAFNANVPKFNSIESLLLIPYPTYAAIGLYLLLICRFSRIKT